MKHFHYNKYTIIAGVIALCIALALRHAPVPEGVQDNDAITISETRAAHILYGDERGGGHRFGAGVPCKTEFPRGWSDDRILTETRRIAANDNADWRQEKNGYFVTEHMVDGVNVRVVMGDERKRIITAYPTNLPRNPCPANDH